MLAFIPQFVDPARGSVSVQMLVYGVWFAALTALGFALMGIFATGLSRYLYRQPRLVNGLKWAQASPSLRLASRLRR